MFCVRTRAADRWRTVRVRVAPLDEGGESARRSLRIEFAQQIAQITIPLGQRQRHSALLVLCGGVAATATQTNIVAGSGAEVDALISSRRRRWRIECK